MKIVFMGTPDFALKALQSLDKRHEIVCVYSREPKPSGRGHKLTPSPVHAYALEQGFTVRTPQTLKTPEAFEEFAALNADVAIVAAYGMILPEAFLSAFKYGCINIHGSLLPRWRGAAPIQRAVMAGDKETGITFMQMDKGMDTGDMLLQKRRPLQKKTPPNPFMNVWRKSVPTAFWNVLKNCKKARLSRRLSRRKALPMPQKFKKRKVKSTGRLTRTKSIAVCAVLPLILQLGSCSTMNALPF